MEYKKRNCCAMWNGKFLHRTFAFLWKERYTCGDKQTEKFG